MKQQIIAITLMSLFLLPACATNSQEADSDYDSFTVKRGTNIAHFLSQSNRRGAEREAFFTKADVELIASLGFDHIRLPVDEEQLWNEAGEKEAAAFELLHSTLEWCREFDLRVIVDLHILRSHHFNHAEKPLWTDPAEQEKFFDLWRQLSAELKDYPTGMVAYELMNEAVADDPELWNNLLNKAFDAIRELEPQRTIVIGSNRWQSVDTFDDLRIPEGDRNILLSFHFYEPFALTHHKASWTGIKAYDGPVHYPGMVIKKEDLADQPEAVAKQMSGMVKHWDLEVLKAKMAEPLAFAKKHDLPLYCGEFGVYQTVENEITLRWYDDMIKALESQGIGWANWCYRGGFGIFDNDEEVNEELMEHFFQFAE